MLPVVLSSFLLVLELAIKLRVLSSSLFAVSSYGLLHGVRTLVTLATVRLSRPHLFYGIFSPRCYCFHLLSLWEMTGRSPMRRATTIAMRSSSS